VNKPVPCFALLTKQHQRIALLVAEGRTDRDIADRLFIEPVTVKNHLQSIYMALHLPMSNKRNPRVLLTRWVLTQEHEP
jgi:DNA-binding NarL/FixJ family response regulator